MQNTLFQTRTYTHTLNVGYSDVGPGVRTTNLESPEEIQIMDQMYCSNSIHIYTWMYIVKNSRDKWQK